MTTLVAIIIVAFVVIAVVGAVAVVATNKHRSFVAVMGEYNASIERLKTAHTADITRLLDKQEQLVNVITASCDYRLKVEMDLQRQQTEARISQTVQQAKELVDQHRNKGFAPAVAAAAGVGPDLSHR